MSSERKLAQIGDIAASARVPWTVIKLWVGLGKVAATILSHIHRPALIVVPVAFGEDRIGPFDNRPIGDVSSLGVRGGKRMRVLETNTTRYFFALEAQIDVELVAVNRRGSPRFFMVVIKRRRRRLEPKANMFMSSHVRTCRWNKESKGCKSHLKMLIASGPDSGCALMLSCKLDR
jgi:hypothetical protein